MASNRLLYEEENRVLSLYLEDINDDFRKKYRPPDWLKHAQSPFLWSLSLKRELFVNSNIPDKLQDYQNQGPDYGFEKFAYLLSLMFLRSIKFNEASSSDDSSESEDSDTEDCTRTGDMPTSFHKFDPELAYTRCREALDEMAARPGDVVYTRIGPALEHVLQATRAHMLLLAGNIAESKEIANNIQPILGMSNENLAGIEGIKAKFILSSYQDLKQALDAIKNAVELDSSFAAWLYWTGKIIRRSRRDEKETISKEELEYFEKAVNLERNPKYIVFYAQACQEIAISIIQKKNPGTSESIDELMEKAVTLYRECWALKSDSAPIARRVGNGMMKMRNEFIDLVLTKEALLKAVELSPCCVTLHSLGKFYLVHEQDEEKAMECFNKVGSIYGTGEIIRHNLIKNPNYDPLDLIKKWIALAANIVKRDMIYCDVGWYYLTFKRDIFLAAYYFWKVLSKNFNNKKILEFQSFAFCVYGPLNMLKILVNDVMLAVRESYARSPDEEKELEFLGMFLEKVLEKHPEFIGMEPDPNLSKKVKEDVDRDIINIRKRMLRSNTKKKRTESEGNWRLRNDSVGDSSDHSDQQVNRWRQRGYEQLETSNVFDSSKETNINRSGMRFRYSSNPEELRPERRIRCDSDRGGRSGEGTSPGSDNVREGFNFREGGPGSRNFEHRGGVRREESGFRYNIDQQRRDEMSQRGSSNNPAGAQRRGQSNYNNNRYDVTITNWRSENKRGT